MKVVDILATNVISILKTNTSLGSMSKVYMEESNIHATDAANLILRNPILRGIFKVFILEQSFNVILVKVFFLDGIIYKVIKNTNI